VRLLQAPNRTLVKLAVDPIGMTKPPGGLPAAKALTPGASAATTATIAARIVDELKRRTATLLRLTNETEPISRAF
jgi:hypothetical protein